MKKKKDKIIIVKVSPEFTKFYCLSDWPCVCRSTVRALLLAGRISLKSFSQSMCQTGMQRINLQPETKIWKCPGGPGGMFLTPDSFSDVSDPTCLAAGSVQLCQVQPWAAAVKAESVAAAELGQEHQAQHNLLTIPSVQSWREFQHVEESSGAHHGIAGRARVLCLFPWVTGFVQLIILYYWVAAVRKTRHWAEELYLEVPSGWDGLETAQSSWK